MNDCDKPVVVVVPGDLHLTEAGLQNVHAAHRVVDDVNTLIRPDFVQFIGVNVWSLSRVCAVRYRIDDGPWAGLEASDDGHWQSRLTSDLLTKGVHTLDVVAVAADGTEGSERIDFVVDPTGRYTAVPDTRPPVSATQFC